MRISRSLAGAIIVLSVAAWDCVGDDCIEDKAPCAEAERIGFATRMIDSQVADLESRTVALERAIAAASFPLPPQTLADFTLQLSAIDREAGIMMQHHGIIFSHITFTLGNPRWEKTADLRADSNKTAERLARIRDYLIELQKKLGLSARWNGSASPSLVPQGRRLKLDIPINEIKLPTDWLFKQPEILDLGGPSLLGQTLPLKEKKYAPGPSASPAYKLNPYHLSGLPIWVSKWLYGSSYQNFELEAQEAAKVRARHERSESITAGKPEERASLVHLQKGNTCAIAVQSEFLRAYNAAPLGTPEQQEDALFKESVQKHYYIGTRQHGHITAAHAGDLLQDHGLLIAQHALANDEELVAAAGTGKMLLVVVAADLLWYDESQSDGSHMVLLTGVELEAKDPTKPLGFYINDTGYAGGGRRLMPAERFYKAWHSTGSQFIEAR